MAPVDNLPAAGNQKDVKPKRILYVEGNVDGTVGGSYYVLYDLVVNLDQSMYRPVVVFYFDHFLVAELREKGIETYVCDRVQPVILPLSNSTSPIGQMVYQAMRPLQRLINIFRRLVIPALQWRRFLKQKRIDLVDLNNSVNRNHEWMLAAALADVPCMTHEMGINNTFAPLARWFAPRMKAIVPVSHVVEANMRRLGLDYDHIQTIHNGIDPARYTVQRTPAQLRDQFGLDDGRPLIGVIGNIKVWKGQEVAVRATHIIKQTIPDICCLLVGGVADGDRAYHRRLQQICADLGLKDNVIFTDFQNNPIDFMNMMDVVIHPSIDPEPFGIVNLEAMLVRKPVVSTTIGAPLEIFEDGVSGVLVEPNAPCALATACIKILNDPQRARRLGDAAHARLQSKFTIQRMVEQNEALYHRLLYSEPTIN